MIGRMYRPLKILTTPENRGYMVLNKYKSNFGGTSNFTVNINMNYEVSTQSEVIHMEFSDLTIPLLIEEGILLEDNRIVSTTEKKTVDSLRNLYRPSNISSKDTLEFDMQIKSVFANKDTENDVLRIVLQPVIYKNEEYLKVFVKCTTPVVFFANTSMTLAEEE